jgi:hypothetical protein
MLLSEYSLGVASMDLGSPKILACGVVVDYVIVRTDMYYGMI